MKPSSIHCLSFLLFAFIMAGCIKQVDETSPGRKYRIEGTWLRPGSDPYLQETYRSLNESPMQARLRDLSPFPVGVVYWQQQGVGLDSIRKDFRVIRSLGYTALKQVQLADPDNPPGFEESVFHAAIDEGLIPWYYGKGGWERISPELLERLGVEESARLNPALIQQDPRVVRYQDSILHRRVERMKYKPPRPGGMGEPGRNAPYLTPDLVPYFARWLQAEYGTLEALKAAWNEGTTGRLRFSNFMDAAREMEMEYTDQYGFRWGKRSWDFRRVRDAMKFQSELVTSNYRAAMELFTEWDPEEPERTGGHQLFENQPINGWDLEAQARAASVGGSFYASIHLTHHFFLVSGEYLRPVYMQSRMVADMFKGGWAATWESTGGPTQWSGMQNRTMDAGVMTQLALSYIAAGLRGIGIWTWNSRDAGWEAGEYALTDLQGRPTERAVALGHISSVLQEQRFELWEAMDEPLVGVLYSWENEAMLARLSMGSYPLSTPVYHTDRDRQFRQYHSQARTGISRALMNGNIPFEYLTGRDLEEGLAARYPVIYLPCVVALGQGTLELLASYVRQGGRLVADFPLCMLDEYGRLNKFPLDGTFEELFGFRIRDYYHTDNHPLSLAGMELKTQFGDLELTGAVPVEVFSDGTPAVVTSTYGLGETLVFNFEAGRLLFGPGQPSLEQMAVFHTVGSLRAPFEVEAPENLLVYRRSAPLADHYFLVNEGGEARVRISSGVIGYTAAEDLLRGKIMRINVGNLRIGGGFTVTVPARSGTWVRAEKSSVPVRYDQFVDSTR